MFNLKDCIPCIVSLCHVEEALDPGAWARLAKVAEYAALKGAGIGERRCVVEKVEFVAELPGLLELFERDMVSALHVFRVDVMATPFYALPDALLGDFRVVHANVEHHDTVADSFSPAKVQKALFTRQRSLLVEAQSPVQVLGYAPYSLTHRCHLIGLAFPVPALLAKYLVGIHPLHPFWLPVPLPSIRTVEGGLSSSVHTCKH